MSTSTCPHCGRQSASPSSNLCGLALVGKDCLAKADDTLVRVGDPHEPFSWDWQGPLGEFFRGNAETLDHEDRATIRATVERGETHHDGGGAAAEWAVWAVREQPRPGDHVRLLDGQYEGCILTLLRIENRPGLGGRFVCKRGTWPYEVEAREVEVYRRQPEGGWKD